MTTAHLRFAGIGFPGWEGALLNECLAKVVFPQDRRRQSLCRLMNDVLMSDVLWSVRKFAGLFRVARPAQQHIGELHPTKKWRIQKLSFERSRNCGFTWEWRLGRAIVNAGHIHTSICEM